MLPNHHITKPVLIGEIQADGQFEVVWQTDGLVPGDAWSDFLPESKMIEADWTAPINVRQLQHRDQDLRRRRRGPVSLATASRTGEGGTPPSPPLDDHRGTMATAFDLRLIALAAARPLLAIAPALAQTADADLTPLVDALGAGQLQGPRSGRRARSPRPATTRVPPILAGARRRRPLRPRSRRQGRVRRRRPGGDFALTDPVTGADLGDRRQARRREGQGQQRPAPRAPHRHRPDDAAEPRPRDPPLRGAEHPQERRPRAARAARQRARGRNRSRDQGRHGAGARRRSSSRPTPASRRSRPRSTTIAARGGRDARDHPRPAPRRARPTS